VTLFTIQNASLRPTLAWRSRKPGLSEAALFEWYVSSKNVRAELQAGTYALRPNMSLRIWSRSSLTARWRQSGDYFAGQRLDQIRDMLIKAGFNTADVTTALSASTYVGSPALADNPVGTSLEGFLYPDSFQRTETTNRNYRVGIAR